MPAPSEISPAAKRESHSGGAAFIDALNEQGVRYIFANLGSDHPGIVEALARAQALGEPAPRLLTCPSEMVALSIAHGYAQQTGKPQAVLVHVECGTQSLGGAVHNAAKGRVPVLIFAGASPFTQEGELPGGRNEFIQWIQDVSDQRGIVRGYMRYDNEVRSGRNLKQIVHRAMQFAASDPKGPVYLMAAREILEEEVEPTRLDVRDWPALAPAALGSGEISTILDTLLAARRPLVVTSYIGRNPAAVGQLARFCKRLGIGVLESVPNHMNFPASDPLYQGNQWNEPVQNAVLGQADAVLVIDSDVPWIPSVNRPGPQARIIHIDVDPLKERMPLWQIPAFLTCRADAGTALLQLNEALAGHAVDGAGVAERSAHYSTLHDRRARLLREREAKPESVITPAYLTACVRDLIGDDSIVINEGISNYQTIFDHLRLSRAGSIFTSGGGSLGWNGGAAIGAKLACPERTVVALTGDGSYMFSAPSAVHWMARRYETPFLQIIYNNRGWKSPKLSTLAVHPDGFASRAEDIGVSFEPAPDFGGIAAAAGGAWSGRVDDPAKLEETLAEALHAVRTERRCAVLDVILAPL
jgi:acetolactate synthase-1/2/3 large subunit